MKRPDNNGAKKTKREKGRHRRKDEGQAKGRSRHEGNIDEDDGDIAAEIEMDEPERFQSDTRLRHRGETSYQRKLRKLKNKRRGIVESSTEESSSDEDSDSDDSDDSQDFLTDSGESLAEGVMPAEFSLNAAQTTEFKFKVVFQYLVLLAIKGPRVLPLKGEQRTYFLQPLQELRSRVDGFKNLRVRSQIWKLELVHDLETFHNFLVSITCAARSNL